MSITYSQKDIVDIIDILYIKIMRLKSSYDFSSIFTFNGNASNQYPDLVYSLKYSFAVDAYTSIDALFSSGKYSFDALKKQNVEFKLYFDEAKKKLNYVLPDFTKNRDKLFCHFVEKQSENEVNDICFCFPKIFDLLTELHKHSMECFCVENSEIRAMTEKQYLALQKQQTDFSMLIIDALLNESLYGTVKERMKNIIQD